MRNLKYVNVAASLVLLLFFSGVALGCVQPPPPPPATPEPVEPTPEHTEEVTYFVEDQVIVIGAREDVDRVIPVVEDQLGIELLPERRVAAPFLAGPVILEEPSQDKPYDRKQTPEPQDQSSENQSVVQRVNVSFTSDFSADLGVQPRLAQPADNPPVLDLYRIVDTGPATEQVSVDTVVDAIRGAALDIAREVIADPNYVTGRAPIEVEGDPTCDGGSPASGAGPGAVREDFRDQWALGPDGIGLYTGTGTSRQRTVVETGWGVRIGVFDTTPFRFPDKGEFFEGLNLALRHYEVRPNPDLRDHGLSVAGLIREVAPASEIRLFRVLNESARGDLFTLYEALETFIDETLQERGSLKHTVINLSLGVHTPPNPDKDLAERIQSLRRVLERANRHGAIIVAAAGNDSGASLSSPKLPQLPAAYDFVIGVAASNIAGDRACFSNADPSDTLNVLAAPGGDGGTNCEVMTDQCGTNGKYCVISQALEVSPETHFAYWSGTSFAAPLVSGLAALVLEHERASAGPVTSTGVLNAMELGTCHSADLTLPSGIVNAPKALSSVPCP